MYEINNYVKEYYINNKLIGTIILEKPDREKLGYPGKRLEVLNTDIHIQEKTFDTIMYMDVLEHIEDDKKEVNKALKHLNLGGNLIFFVPAYQFLYSDFDKSIGHIKRYNKQFFLSFKENENISIVELKYFDTIGFFFAVLINRKTG